MAKTEEGLERNGEANGKPERHLDLGVLSESIGYHLRRAQLRVFEHFAHSFAALDLRPAQFSVLVVVDRNPGLRQSEAAAALGIQRTNFVPLVDELERRGLLERRASPADRRSHALHVTEAGERLLAEALALQASHEEEWTRRAGAPDRATFVNMLQRLAES